MTDTSYAYPKPASPVPSVEWQRHRRRGGIFWGIVLIVLGAVFLSAQFVPGLVWSALWPLIFVVVGLAKMVTPGHDGAWSLHRVFDGFGTVLLGAVLLGNTTGVVSWSVWWTLLTLWPVLLVALGVSMIGRGIGMELPRSLSHVVVWSALAFAVAVSLTGRGGFYAPAALVGIRGTGTAFAYSDPGAGVNSATLDLESATGDVRIDSGTKLVSASGTSPFGAPRFNVARSGDTAEVTLGPAADGADVWPGIGGRTELALSDSALWDATISTGASNLDADLSDVRVSRLTVKSGASSVAVKLGDVPLGVDESELVVKTGVSNVTVYVPKGVDARVETHDGLSGTHVSGGFVSRSSGVFETPGYSAGDRAWNINVASGVGAVSIETY